MDQGKRTKAVTAGKVKQEGVKLGGDLKYEKDAKFLDVREEIWNKMFQKQQKVYEGFPREEIKIIMPDGNVKTGKSFETSPYDIAKGISNQFAEKCIVAKVRYSKRVATLDDGLLNPEAEDDKDEKDQWFYWDVNRKLEGDCELFLYKFDNEEGRETFWHSSAHILGQALEKEFGIQLTIGPPTDNGFFYDSYTGKNIFKEDDYGRIEKAAKKVTDEKQKFDRLVLTKEEALELFSDNPFKVSLISNKIPAGGKVTAYKCGKLIDLCTGPHISSTKIIKAFKVTKNSASNWLGKVENDSLQRVYGISFPSKKELDEYIHRMEEAAKRDHRTIAKQQKIMFVHELSPGCAFFEPRGMYVYNKLIEIIRHEYRVRGYQEVLSPNIFNLKLWKTSGHYSKYKDNLFLMKVENSGFGLKPMNCPAHCLMFAETLRSFRDLPIRYGDFGVLHRNEITGALSGLTRVRRFQQDDGHHFCTMEQIQDEILIVLDFLEHTYGLFEFEFELELSTRPEARLGADEVWDQAEAALEAALNQFGKPWKLNPGDGAFYGPKIDVKVFDALKRPHQCGTIQLDFQLPIRFDLQYKTNQVVDASADDKDEKKVQTFELFKPDEFDEDEFEWKEQPVKKGFARPVIIHRAILGSVERFMAILIEHTAGKWPFFISPRQAIIVPISEKFNDYCQGVYLYLHRQGYQVELDLSNNTLNKKILMNQKAQWNFILVAGEKEAAAGTVDVRTRENKRIGTKRIDQLHEYFLALLPRHSNAHIKFYEKQWNLDDYVSGAEAAAGHIHDEQHYFVNPEELNLYVDTAQNKMGLMIQVVSEIAGTKMNVRYTNEDAPTLIKSYPYLVTENETIFDAEAIAQHIARFNPQAGLNGNTQFQKAMVNEWISWCQLKWIPVMNGPLNPVLGHSKNFNQEEYSKALTQAMKVAIELDEHLRHMEDANLVDWIVYEKPSLADIFIGSCFITVFQTIFDQGVRLGVPHLSKWFDRFCKHLAVVEFFGHIKVCKKATIPSAGTKSDSSEQAAAAPAALMKQLTMKPKQNQLKKVEEVDEDDLFGTDDEEDKDAIKKVQEDAKKNNKKKKKEVIAQSLVMFEVKPADSETDLDKVAQDIFKIKQDGLYWKTQYKKEPVAFGIFKLLIGVTVEDEKVSVDGLQEKIEELDDVQSVDILAFNKI